LPVLFSTVFSDYASNSKLATSVACPVGFACVIDQIAGKWP